MLARANGGTRYAVIFGHCAPDKLNRIIVTPSLPCLIDVRNDEDYAADQRFIPASIRRDYRTVAE
ncbi:hypothetical protein AGR9A_Lc40096 [Agrobacterium salinitolerans str. Hayward 0363]|nr:hypothetical protein AGR9A_Lc40096 [Agrobacterium salinitolerans str. Hayward 0363]